MTAPSPVLALDALGRGDVALAGGKGANLGELVRAGFPVPPGFVVTTDAYARVAEELDIAGWYHAGDAAAIRAALASVVVPADLRTRITEAYDALGSGQVAVRSSATAEDLPGAAFAGQQDTYLGIAGADAVVDAVRRCWASLWTDRAIAYRKRLGIAPDEVAIAVVVQSLIDADAAGVLFTADPVTGHRGRLILDASAGLGESVVSGLVTPDHLVLDEHGSLLSWTPGRREVVIRPTADGVRHEAGTATAEPLLEPTEIAALARLGAAVQAHFGRPQDLEWALADGSVFLLQARPMTALPPPPIRLNPIQKRVASVLLDYLPVRPYPLDVTTWWRFGPAGLMLAIARGLGIHIDEARVLPEIDDVVYRFAPPMPQLTPKALTAPFRILWRAARHDPARWHDDPHYVRFEAAVNKLRAARPERMRWGTLLRVPAAVAAAITPITKLRADYLPGSALAIGRLLAILTLLGKRRLLGNLLVGARTRTTDGNDALLRLAAEIRSTPSLQAVFAHDPADIEGALASLAGADHFRAGFASFLHEYGHRETVSPVLASSPTWSEQPVVALGLLAVLATAEDPNRTSPAGDAESELLRHPLLARAASRRRVLRILERAREGIRFREDSHFEFLRLLPPLRSALLEMGRRLVASGLIAIPEDVFHLRLEELQTIADPQRMPSAQAARLRSAIRRRAARRDELASVKLLDLSQVFPAPTGGVLVQGSPASGGVATGRVRIIRDATDFGTLQSGEILVCPYTNPSWTPLFSRAAAVVVDSGGVGSHAAIVAREYGLPAVMGTGAATTVLTPGQLVTVDGNTGRVTATDAGGTRPRG
ncbi:PEP/pyruvate-binding domain-containing protein [Mycetocola sp. 2940]|uniref:PEP/pyruvate-binding domain-containing protein n=1 Tax=Mycetocola sp. 2940 TaxID=3156452 RepID=UPI0033936EB7